MMFDKFKEMLGTHGAPTKYLIIGYHESDGYDESSSEFYIENTDDVGRATEKLHYYKHGYQDWEVCLFVNGVPTPVTSFAENIANYEAELERQRQEYLRKQQEAEAKRMKQYQREKEKNERAEYERLKAKFEGK